jgi:Fur family transcriptional regulator, ferric uptake regulator
MTFEPAKGGRNMTEATARPVGRVRHTRQAAVVQDIMREADGFRTASELFEESRRRGSKIGLATIYRYLKLFTEQGTADMVHRDDGEAQYRLCRAGSAMTDDTDHHHHLVCRVCGRSEEVEGPEVEQWAALVAAQAGFTEITHTVEIFGLCPEHSTRPARRGTA